MRVAAFVLGLVVLAPALATSDTIGLAVFTVVEDGATSTVMTTATGRIYCSRYKQCNGSSDCTPVPVTSISYQDSASKFTVIVTLADPTNAGTSLVARGDGMTPTAGFANVHVRTTSETGWPMIQAGTVFVEENEYGKSPFRAVVTLSGITDGTRTLDGTIECPDEYIATGGGGCGGGGGGGHSSDGLDD
jgi:hypothetical protein